MILVTGGTGFIGSYLLCFLSQKNNKIRALYRSEEKQAYTRKIFAYYNALPQFQQIEWFRADLNDIPALDQAFDGIEQVYHAAAIISFDGSRFEELKKVNVEGTANLVNLSLKHGVEKFCHLSSVAALGENTEFINEETPWNPDADNHVYGITKYGAEMEVWRGAQEGLKVVIVNPSIVLGAGFWNSGSGRLFARIYKGMKYYLPGKMGFVDVEDVARAMLLLMESPICNERFILNAENMAFQKVMEKIAIGLEKNIPNKPLKMSILLFLRGIDILRSLVTSKPREIFKPAIASAFKSQRYNSEKFIAHTHFTFTPIDETLRMCCQRFLEQHAAQKT